jgi:hypothetical protein
VAITEAGPASLRDEQPGFDWRLALTWLVVSYGMFLTYEWVHFLIHSSYRPKRCHVLRTFPEKDEVPVSETAFTLGVDVATMEAAA